MANAQSSAAPARIVALIGALLLAASFFLPAMTFSSGGGGSGVRASGQAGTGWDLADASFQLMRAVGTPDSTMRGDQWKLYAMAYAWAANFTGALVLLGCVCAWTQARVLWVIASLAGGALGITGVVVLFADFGNPGPASLAWCGSLLLAFIAACMLPKAH